MAVKKMKKLISVIAIVAMLTATMLCVSAVSAIPEDGVSVGPIENSGDGVPGNNYFPDLPENPGEGPAPNAGSGDQDGPGW